MKKDPMETAVGALKFITRSQREDFLESVALNARRMEETALDDILKSLAEKVGKRAWRYGYTIEEFELLTTKMPFKNQIAIGVLAKGLREDETVRQWCYQFVDLADRAMFEVNMLREQLEGIKKRVPHGILYPDGEDCEV